MNDQEYAKILLENFERAHVVASEARAKGLDPDTKVEIKLAQDLAARVEGIIGLDGVAITIREKAPGKTRQELAFEMTREICLNPKFEQDDTAKRITLAVRLGLAVLTEGVLVAPTEGIQGVKFQKNPDGSDYIAILYAGPIRGAGGSGAALSVALADCARKSLNISRYQATQNEIERYLEEIMIYHARVARLQYPPHEEEIRHILQNCPICIDGVPTEEIEVAIHRNVKRFDKDYKEELITNKIRGGIGLVVCEGIAQKAKSVLKYSKAAGLEWDWLNTIIKVAKPSTGAVNPDEKNISVFLEELVAGRPVLAYPDYPGAFRLRYGRSRFTGIAAKGFNPATMVALYEFIATGTQLKIEKPGKGCVGMPVDSIEGPFIKLADGRAMRVNDAKVIREVASQIKKIISVGDVLVTYGDFRKSNNPLMPTSYVEEYWQAQLERAGFSGTVPATPSFMEALELSEKYGVPMHPKYIYEYQDVDRNSMLAVVKALRSARVVSNGGSIFAVEHLIVNGADVESARMGIERLCIPHNDSGTEIRIESDDAQSLLMSFGIMDREGTRRADQALGEEKDAVVLINTVSPFKIMRRSTRIGGRIGRPEKAKERLMKTSINVLYPISEYGGKERNITKAYANSSRSFGTPKIEVDMARYRCSVGNEIINSFHCEKHDARANVERRCRNCGHITMFAEECPKCKGGISGWEKRGVPLVEACNESMKRLGYQVMPKMMKGVKGLSNRNKVCEPLEKGILRSAHGVSIFKDGTARFDATDAPITHFYPSEIGTSVEILKKMGYDRDMDGKELVDPNQLVELKHHDVLLNKRGGEYLLKVSKFVDDLLVRFYKMEPFYRAQAPEDLLGHFVMTLSPHTSAGVLCRIIGFTDASVGFAHPYIICARRRNCDGDEDTTMLLLDALINFSRNYLPTTIGGTMDAPLIMAVHVKPEEVDDEVHVMEVTRKFGVDFYDKTFTLSPPSEAKVETVADRFGTDHKVDRLEFTHLSGINALSDAPKRSMYTRLNNMDEKVQMQFKLMDILESIDKADTAKRLIRSHFVPDLVGNLHSFSKQSFRCISCNSKYRRVPLAGHCTRCGGKIVLTISRGGIQKYMVMAIKLAERYNLDTYMKQNLMLIKNEITGVFGSVEEQGQPREQQSLSKFM